MQQKVEKRKPNYFHGPEKDHVKPFPDGPKSLFGLALWLKRALFAFVPLAVLELFFTAFAMFNLNGYIAFFTNLGPNYPLVFQALSMVGIVYRIVYIVCIFLTCRLLYRAARNVHTVMPETIETTPLAAWFWFFIPLANFYMPYKAIKDIFRGTHAALGMSGDGHDQLILWWLLYIISVFIGTFTLELDGLNLFYFGLGVDIISGILVLIAVPMFIQIIMDLTRKQEALLSGGAASVFD